MTDEREPQEIPERYVVVLEQVMREFAAWEQFCRYNDRPVWMMRLRNTKLGRRILMYSEDGVVLHVVPSAFIVRIGKEFTEHQHDERRTVDLQVDNLHDTLRQTISWACRVDLGLEQKR